MKSQRWFSLTRLIMAALGFTALTGQYLYNTANIPNYQPVNFFSFFTVESNIIAAVAFLIAGLYGLFGRLPFWVQFLRGAATIYMTITGIVYTVLLSNVQVDTAVPWINIVLHYIVPIVILIDWFLDLPGFRITFGSAMVWLIYPILYLAYSLIRGPLVDWYPYPFLDPRPEGYVPVILTSILIAVVGLLFALFLSWTTRFRSRP